jgi:hypothetical protein
MRDVRGLVLLAAVALPAGAWCEAPACSPTAWTTVAPNPTARYATIGATDGTFFYSIGGSTLASMVANNDRYDPVGNAWLARAPMPVPVQDAPAVAFSSKIYVFGGLNSTTQQVFQNLQIYDIALDTWTTGAPLPAPRFGSYVGVFGNHAYVVGGYPINGVNTATATTFEYDLLANSWTTRAPMPDVNGLGASATIGPFLYTFGGWNSDPCCNGDAYRYDMSTNTWTTIASLPTAVEGATAGVVEGQIWIAGGGTPFGPAARPAGPPDQVNALGITQVYHPATDTYGTGPAMNQARVRFAGATIPGQGVFVTTGYTGAVVTDASESNVCPVPVELMGIEVN